MVKLADFKHWSAHARKRLYLSLPYLGALLAGYGILEDSQVALWVGFLGVALGPIQGHVAAANVEPDGDETHGGPSKPGV